MKKIIAAILVLTTLVSATLFSPTVGAVNVSDSEMVSAAAEIIRRNEGWYHSVRADDNGALSIGWIQWHGNRALSLLKTIIAADTKTAKQLLGDKLYKEATTATDWSTRVLNDDEAKRVSGLIDTDAGHKAQDDLAASDITKYIKHGKDLGISSPATLVYFADLENQCGGGGAAKIAKAASEKVGSYMGITLDVLYTAALEDVAGGRQPNRRSETYSYCVLLGWDEFNGDCEVWTATDNVNIRKGPGVTNELTASLPKGSNINIIEKRAVGSALWGLSTVGWLCLDYCEYRLGSIASPVIFNAGEGDLGEAVSTLSADGINEYRGEELLIVYNDQYTQSETGTNRYGAEAVVDSNGQVSEDPVIGSCKSRIPKGGFVISGHNSRGYEICSKLKAGVYVYFDSVAMTLTVFNSRDAYLAASKTVTADSAIGALPVPSMPGSVFAGWYTSPSVGTKVDETTVFTTHKILTLYARYASEAPVSFNANGGTYDNTATQSINGINTSRSTNTLILYNSERGSSTGTNEHGFEVVINADGSASGDPKWGGNTVIPDVGFVLSGHGTMGSWLYGNVRLGSYVTFDSETNSITVYKDAETYNSLVKNLKKDSPIGSLPMIHRDGYDFMGWYNAAGEKVSEKTAVPLGGIELWAQWTKHSVPGDINGDGSVDRNDLSIMMDIITGRHKPNENELMRADLNNDRNINTKDIYYLKRIIAENKK